MKRIIKNVLTNNERKKLIKDCQSYLLDANQLKKEFGDEDYPGKQTEANLQNIPCFKDPIDKIVFKIANVLKQHLVLQKAWINCTNGKKKDISWHNHSHVPLTAVYYMKIFPLFSNGTLFKDGFIKTSQNSILVTPGYLNHTAPSSPLRFDRYTLALDLAYNG